MEEPLKSSVLYKPKRRLVIKELIRSLVLCEPIRGLDFYEQVRSLICVHLLHPFMYRWLGCRFGQVTVAFLAVLEAFNQGVQFLLQFMRKMPFSTNGIFFPAAVPLSGHKAKIGIASPVSTSYNTSMFRRQFISSHPICLAPFPVCSRQPLTPSPSPPRDTNRVKNSAKITPL